MEHVLARSRTIALASAQLNAARADARVSAADTSPRLGVDAGASQAGGPLINAAGGSGTLFTARATLAWEADLAGRLSDAKAAARLDATSAEAMLRQTRLLVAAQAVQAYWRAQFLAADAGLMSQRVGLCLRQLERTRLRQAHGLASTDAVVGATTELSASRAELTEIERQRSLAVHELQFLAGTAEPIEIAPLADKAPPEIPAGLPSELLARRADIAAAEADFLAADKRLSAARKSWLPSISLTASGGAASPSLGQILGATAQSFGLNLLFSLPLLDGGRHKATVGRRRAELESASVRYAERVYGALREVNDALANVRAARQSFELAAADAATADHLYSSAQASADHGLLTVAAVDQRSSALVARRQIELGANFARHDAALELVRSLGGGW